LRRNGIVATTEISNFFAKRFTQICIPIGTLAATFNSQKYKFFILPFRMEFKMIRMGAGPDGGESR
jgi:hypothetical protein